MKLESTINFLGDILYGYEVTDVQYLMLLMAEDPNIR